METKSAQSPFWWTKSPHPAEKPPPSLTIPKLDLEISSSLADFLEKEQNILDSSRADTEVDVGSIIEEINRVAAQSPLGPYEQPGTDRSIGDIMKEAERIYMESSRSFEQLSQKSKTSHNITEIGSNSSKESTPTPKSVSPLPNDESADESETYSEDFSADSKMSSEHENGETEEKGAQIEVNGNQALPPTIEEENIELDEEEKAENFENVTKIAPSLHNEEIEVYEEKIAVQSELINTLRDDNKQLREDIRAIKNQLQETSFLLTQTKAALTAKSLASPEINIELEKTLEKLKDTQEINTSLQYQLDTINKTYTLLKNSYDNLTTSNQTLERRLTELDASLSRYKNELESVQQTSAKHQQNEAHLASLLEAEKLNAKSMKQQNDKDAKCILDLNRQIKEMERIIARKHPDSVSALIVAAKNSASDTNMTARKVLEDRIKTLENEASSRDTQSSRIFLDVQEKFNQMKLKYESHIEDLEVHVNDLKNQLKRKIDSFDVYTQTHTETWSKIPEKDSATIGTQTQTTEAKSAGVGNNRRMVEMKEDAHLLATIRGLQADLSNKEKVLTKVGREIAEMRKTNWKLQKEREGSLRGLNEKKEFRSYPEKLAQQANRPIIDEDVRVLRIEKDKMKAQLCRIEEDYQALKNKRMQDLNALQDAHEKEMATYVGNITPLREQLELQQVSINALQSQLSAAKEELLIVTVERDHLNSQFSSKEIIGEHPEGVVEALQKKITFLEKRYEEREFRLRAIVHGLAQKSATNRGCEQCAERQQQLIGYKDELDQLLATLRALK